MWFTGRLQRTGGNDPQTIKTCLSVPSHTRPEQHRDCLGPVNGKMGFSPTEHSLVYNTNNCVAFPTDS